jgi:hypothetical protein
MKPGQKIDTGYPEKRKCSGVIVARTQTDRRRRPARRRVRNRDRRRGYRRRHGHRIAVRAHRVLDLKIRICLISPRNSTLCALANLEGSLVATDVGDDLVPHLIEVVIIERQLLHGVVDKRGKSNRLIVALSKYPTNCIRDHITFILCSSLEISEVAGELNVRCLHINSALVIHDSVLLNEVREIDRLGFRLRRTLRVNFAHNTLSRKLQTLWFIGLIILVLPSSIPSIRSSYHHLAIRQPLSSSIFPSLLSVQDATSIRSNDFHYR